MATVWRTTTRRPAASVGRQAAKAGSAVTPRFSVRLGYLRRPGSLCTKPLWPPSTTSWTSTSTARPATSWKAATAAWPTSTRKRPAWKGGNSSGATTAGSDLERPPARALGGGGLVVEAAVDGGDLGGPGAPVRVLQGQQFGQGPVQVVGQIGYLLAEPLEGVAADSPAGGTSAV